MAEKEKFVEKKIEEKERDKTPEKEVDSAVEASIDEKTLEQILARSTYKVLQDELVRRLEEDLKSLSHPYPDILGKEFFYVRPHKNFVNSWLRKWADIILIFCSKNNRFIVNLDELTYVYPFRSKKFRKVLSREELRDIIDVLVEEGKAKWLDGKKDVALIYWVSPTYILDRIILRSREIGFKYITIHLLDKVLPDLPLEEKIALLNTIVKKNKGVWIKKNYAVRLHI